MICTGVGLLRQSSGLARRASSFSFSMKGMRCATAFFITRALLITCRPEKTQEDEKVSQ